MPHTKKWHIDQDNGTPQEEGGANNQNFYDQQLNRISRYNNASSSFNATTNLNLTAGPLSTNANDHLLLTHASNANGRNLLHTNAPNANGQHLPNANDHLLRRSNGSGLHNQRDHLGRSNPADTILALQFEVQQLSQQLSLQQQQQQQQQEERQAMGVLQHLALQPTIGLINSSSFINNYDANLNQQQVTNFLRNPSLQPSLPRHFGQSLVQPSVYVHPSLQVQELAQIQPIGNIARESINDNDVLCGRGGISNTHNGNVAYREVVNRQKGRYSRATKKEKPSIASEIVEKINNMTPRGRFLKKVAGDSYDEITEAKAIEKTCQALREGRKQTESQKINTYREVKYDRGQNGTKTLAAAADKNLLGTEMIDQTLESRLAQLKEFIGKFGALALTKSTCRDEDLYNYCQHLRQRRKNIPVQTVKELDMLGFIWDVQPYTEPTFGGEQQARNRKKRNNSNIDNFHPENEKLNSTAKKRNIATNSEAVSVTNNNDDSSINCEGQVVGETIEL